jgi:predicted transcriptional regulator
MRKRGRRAGDLEREVLVCLAAADAPMTAVEVQAAVGGDLAYTTVLTALSRLHAKDALVRTPGGRAYRYELVALGEAEAAAIAHRMRRTLDRGSDRASVLTRFVSELTPADEQTLRALLKRPDATDR